MADTLNYLLMYHKSLYAFGAAPPDPIPHLVLFTNPFTIAHDTLWSDLIECAVPGYARILLDPSGWIFDVLGPTFVHAYYPTQTFLFSGPGALAETIYGHVILDTYDDSIMWGATWTTAYAIPPGGGSATIDLVWQDQQC